MTAITRARPAFVRLAAALLAAMVGLTAMPASAQMFSEQYSFLEAVRDKDGEAVMAAMNAPGSTIVNARDVANGETALHIVVQRRDATWIRFLTGRGANPNVANRDGVYPLQLAAQLGFNEGVEALIKANARVNISNVAGETPLMFAVHRRDLAMMRLLLEGGADADRTDSSGRSARDYARVQGEAGGTIAVIEEAESDAPENDIQIYGPNL